MDWREVFEYHEDGSLTWKLKNAGKRAGNPRANKYLQVMYNYKSYLVHRVVWEMHHGEIPNGMQVDHINHIRDDNRIENLRIVSNSENHKNKTLSKNNTSGFVGVRWHKKHSMWIANIKVNGKLIHLGLFVDKDLAIKARTEANEKYNFHKNHGECNV